MRIVFHGENAASFSPGFVELLGPGATVTALPDTLVSEADRASFAEAEVIIGTRLTAAMPHPDTLRLYHVPGAGYDGIDLTALPPGANLCNCFGHETAIAEYVMAVLLQRTVPLADADARLRRGEWTYWAGTPERTHAEIAGSTLGLLGFGHIGKAVAARARAFGITVHVANRGNVQGHELVDRAFGLEQLPAFWACADAFVVTVPLTDDTRGIVGPEAFDLMRPHAWLINVARGPVVNEQALFDALHDKRIGGAAIDTWYQYPEPGQPNRAPSVLPFHTLPNIIMTPHMSGWTNGTITRRQAVMADNVRRCMRGESLQNVVRAASA